MQVTFNCCDRFHHERLEAIKDLKLALFSFGYYQEKILHIHCVPEHPFYYSSIVLNPIVLVFLGCFIRLFKGDILICGHKL